MIDSTPPTPGENICRMCGADWDRENCPDAPFSEDFDSLCDYADELETIAFNVPELTKTIRSLKSSLEKAKTHIRYQDDIIAQVGRALGPPPEGTQHEKEPF